MYTKPIHSYSYLISKQKWPILIYALYVTAIYALYSYIGIKEIDIPMAIATVLGFSVALLLGFRTAASYDRWWEGRKLWGAVVNDSRTLVRQLVSFSGSKNSKEVIAIAHYQIVWCRALRNALRKQEPCFELEEYLSKKDLEYLKSQANVPNAILKLMAQHLNVLREKGSIDSFQTVAIDHTLRRLCDAMGACERIKNTVFPIQYRTYTHRGITIFTLMLPFGMLYSTGPFVILISTIVAFFFAMIENIAFFLQDPFRNLPSDVPMNALSRTIEINILQMIGAEKVPPPLEPDKSGIMM